MIGMFSRVLIIKLKLLLYIKKKIDMWYLSPSQIVKEKIKQTFIKKHQNIIKKKIIFFLKIVTREDPFACNPLLY
jgi:hypothetical protein